MCSRLATRGAHLLDRRLELRREVHGRHELIEREALRGRHGLVPGQRCRGTDLSAGRASTQAARGAVQRWPAAAKNFWV